MSTAGMMGLLLFTQLGTSRQIGPGIVVSDYHLDLFISNE
jgi:hypothetical protein